MCVSQFLGKMFTPLASVQVPSQNNIFYSLFTFTLVLERNSSLIIISQVYVCLYALVYVCVWRFLVLLFTPLGLATQHL